MRKLRNKSCGECIYIAVNKAREKINEQMRSESISENQLSVNYELGEKMK
jgi:hypothetical protein